MKCFTFYKNKTKKSTLIEVEMTARGETTNCVGIVLKKNKIQNFFLPEKQVIDQIITRKLYNVCFLKTVPSDTWVPTLIKECALKEPFS